MNGQWIGPYAGTNSGTLVVELDNVGGGFEGSVIAADNNPVFPSVVGEFLVPKDQEKFKVRIPLRSVERATGASLSKETFESRFPGITEAKYADTEWKISDHQIEVAWTTDIGTNGSGVVAKSAAGQPSKLEAIDMSWEKFKAYATNLEPARFFFRGQENNNWKLRTAFHRTGRANLLRFMRQDVGALYRHLIGLTVHRFHLDNPLDYAAFLALVQHHGYPTPLLDWTLSPFIAAYFAFRNIKKASEAQKVRIHALDGLNWNRTFERAAVLAPPFLHMTILEPLALNNPRVLPQQGLSLVTNVDDLEWYIGQKETGGGVKFLTAIDIEVTERSRVLRELALMGINAGSLFPGLDGACQQLRERYFDT
jgi:hypothetical protein